MPSTIIPKVVVPKAESYWAARGHSQGACSMMHVRLLVSSQSQFLFVDVFVFSFIVYVLDSRLAVVAYATYVDS